jgi:hypothetical protein
LSESDLVQLIENFLTENPNPEFRTFGMDLVGKSDEETVAILKDLVEKTPNIQQERTNEINELLTQSTVNMHVEHVPKAISFEEL